MTKPTYVSRELFAAAADIHTPANLSATIDRILQDASRQIDEEYGRHFYPLTETVTYTSPEAVVVAADHGTGFWLNRDLISITSATVDGTTQTVGDIELHPSEYGPPYSWVGLTGSSIAITGVWGFSNDTVPAGSTAEALDASETGVDVTDSSVVGVGDLIIVDTERMVVTEKSLLDTTADLNGDLTADKSNTSVTVTDGTQINQGEVITLDSERMKVISIAADVLTVVRAWDGSTLAAHTGAVNVFTPRTLTVERGAAGSTAASHTTDTAITRNVPPHPITSLCIAEAQVVFQQEQAAYGRTVGSGESEREARGAGLKDARRRASVYKRRRLAAV